MRIADAMCHTCFMLQALLEESEVEVDSMAREWTSPSPSPSLGALPARFLAQPALPEPGENLFLRHVCAQQFLVSN